MHRSYLSWLYKKINPFTHLTNLKIIIEKRWYNKNYCICEALFCKMVNVVYFTYWLIMKSHCFNCKNIHIYDSHFICSFLENISYPIKSWPYFWQFITMERTKPCIPNKRRFRLPLFTMWISHHMLAWESQVGTVSSWISRCPTSYSAFSCIACFDGALSLEQNPFSQFRTCRSDASNRFLHFSSWGEQIQVH